MGAATHACRGHEHGRYGHAGHPAARLLRSSSCHQDVNSDTAWLLHNKILRAMLDRDDVYLGGEYAGGTVGRGLENKIPIMTAISLNEGFSSESVGAWASEHLASGCTGLLTDGLACFRTQQQPVHGYE